MKHWIKSGNTYGSRRSTPIGTIRIKRKPIRQSLMLDRLTMTYAQRQALAKAVKASGKARYQPSVYRYDSELERYIRAANKKVRRKPVGPQNRKNRLERIKHQRH